MKKDNSFFTVEISIYGVCVRNLYLYAKFKILNVLTNHICNGSYIMYNVKEFEVKGHDLR